MSDEKLEILKLRYEDQVELLRFLTSLELKVIFGYFTVVAAIVAWLVTKAPSAFNGKIELILIILTATLSVTYYLYSQKKRRDEAVETVQNLNEALGLYEVGKFVDGKPINPPSRYKPLFWLYLLAIGAVCCVSVYLVSSI